MSDDLYMNYERELAYVRALGEQFGTLYSKVAGRLRLGADGSQDPHVERLIQAFAFLSGRVRQKLDDDFPELTESLLSVLYPHYQAPIPSMGIVQFQLAEGQGDPVEVAIVPKGTNVDTPPIDGTPCSFQTCIPARLWPLAITKARLVRTPFKAPETPGWRRAPAVLHLTIRHTLPGGDLKKLTFEGLKFFLKGQPQHTNLLYELLFNQIQEIAVASSPTASTFGMLDPGKCIKQVGFDRDEGMLPYPARSFLGYRLLTEYFNFPNKFHFFELTGLRGKVPADVTNEMHLFFYLKRDERLEKDTQALEEFVSEDTFRLGCAPVVNLYRKTMDSVKLTSTQYEYRVYPDCRKMHSHEIYSIDDKITSTSPDGDTRDYMPLFSIRHGQKSDGYWQSSRRPAVPEEGEVDHGTDVYLSLVDLVGGRLAEDNRTLDITGLCLNRDVPASLPYGGEPIPLTAQGVALVGKAHPLTPFTRTLRPAMKRGTLWRLISHLSLNHLSLVDGSEQGEALREILRLYEFGEVSRSQSLIDGIKSVRGERIVGRPGGKEICRGIEVTIVFDETNYKGKELYLFASVLERFLGLYCTMNSFTRLVAKIKGGRETLRKWEPRIGEKVLV